jgi:hypothetical protein
VLQIQKPLIIPHATAAALPQQATLRPKFNIEEIKKVKNAEYASKSE